MYILFTVLTIFVKYTTNSNLIIKQAKNQAEFDLLKYHKGK